MFWVQHRFGGMRDGSENGGGILRRKQDLLILSGSMRRDSFKIDGMDRG